MGSSCPQVHLLDIASPHRVPPDRGLCVCVCMWRGEGGRTKRISYDAVHQQAIIPLSNVTCPHSMRDNDIRVQFHLPLPHPPHLRGPRREEQATAIRKPCLERRRGRREGEEGGRGGRGGREKREGEEGGRGGREKREKRKGEEGGRGGRERRERREGEEGGRGGREKREKRKGEEGGRGGRDRLQCTNEHIHTCTIWSAKLATGLLENSYERKYLHCNLVALGNAVQSSTDVHGESQTRNKLGEVVLAECLGFQDLCTALTNVGQFLHQHTGTVASLQE